MQEGAIQRAETSSSCARKRAFSSNLIPLALLGASLLQGVREQVIGLSAGGCLACRALAIDEIRDVAHQQQRRDDGRHRVRAFRPFPLFPLFPLFPRGSVGIAGDLHMPRLARRGPHGDGRHVLAGTMRGVVEGRIEGRAQRGDRDALRDVQQILPHRRGVDAEEPDGRVVDDLHVVVLVYHHRADGRIQDESAEALAVAKSARVRITRRARFSPIGARPGDGGPNVRRGGVVPHPRPPARARRYHQSP